MYHGLNLVGGSESHFSYCFRLLAPKFWEVGGDLPMLFCHSMTAGLSGGDTQTLPALITSVIGGQCGGIQLYVNVMPIFFSQNAKFTSRK